MDDLANYAEAALTPYSEKQCVNLAYRILNRTGIFQRWIIEWNMKPQVQRNWNNFKSHFRQAHHQLKETTNLQARDSVYHANAIRELVDEIKSEIQSTRSTNSISEQEHIPPVTSVSESSNDSSISALQSEVATLKDYINNMHSTNQIPVSPMQQFYPQYPMWAHPYAMQCQPMQAYAQQASSFPTGNQQDNNQPPRKRRIYYCHTHGACFHPGFRCRNKGPNHQDAVTFSNRMGGSTKNVRGVNSQTETQTTTNT